MGKYDKVMPSLAPAPVENTEYQDKVEAVKQQIVKDPKTGAPVLHTPQTLAQGYVLLRGKRDQLKEEMYDLQVAITAWEQLITASWEADEPGWGTHGAGPNTVRLPNGASIDVVPEPVGSVVDGPAFRQWCLAQGLADKFILPFMTMNSMVKERLLARAQIETDDVEGMARTALPAGVEVHSYFAVRLRGAKDK